MNCSNRSLWLGAASMLLSIGCDAQASVGTDPGDCYPGMRCEDLFFDISLPDMLSISSREDVEVLAPTWTLEKLGETSLVQVENAPASAAPGSPALGGQGTLLPTTLGVALALGAEQGLWAFARGQEHLHAWELGASGAVVREATIARPKGAESMPGADAVYSLCNAQSHAAGPVVTLTWQTPCRDERQTLCDAPEILVFQQSLEREPVRLRQESTAGLSSCAQVVFRDSAGDALLIQDYITARVRKVSLSGETLWEQIPPQQVLNDYGYVLQGNITPSDDWIAGRSARSTEYSDAHPADMVFLRVNEHGASLVFAGVAPGVAVVPLQNMVPQPRFDSQGRFLVLTTGGYLSVNQDLWVIRSSEDGAPAKAVSIMREDYLPLLPGPSSVDPQGNVYVTVRIGGPHPDRQDVILRQVRESFDEARCFYIDEVPFALQASGAGVVHTTSAVGIQRYDLP